VVGRFFLIKNNIPLEPERYIFSVDQRFMIIKEVLHAMHLYWRRLRPGSVQNNYSLIVTVLPIAYIPSHQAMRLEICKRMWFLSVSLLISCHSGLV